MTMKQRMARVRAGKRTHKRRRVSGAVGAIGNARRTGKRRPASRPVYKSVFRRKRRVSGIGATGRGGTLKQVAVMAAGIGAGAAFTHMLLRPVEHKLAAKYPMVTKFMGAAEILVGGIIFMKMTNPFIKMMGLGIMAGGTHTVMKQTNLGLHSPAEGTMGYLGDQTHESVRLGNIIDDRRAWVNTPVVGQIAGLGRLGNIVHANRNGAVSTPTVGYSSMGAWNDDLNDSEEYIMPKGL